MIYFIQLIFIVARNHESNIERHFPQSPAWTKVSEPEYTSINYIYKSQHETEFLFSFFRTV